MYKRHVNHNGNLSESHKLIDIAKRAGADFVKFQSFHSNELVSKEASQAKYQKIPGKNQSQLEMLKELEIAEEDFKELFLHCEEVGIKFLSTPFDSFAAFIIIFALITFALLTSFTKAVT